MWQCANQYLIGLEKVTVGAEDTANHKVSREMGVKWTEDRT